MTREEKDLLLKDLCARLPYGVKVSLNGGKEPWTLKGMFDGKHTGMMLILEPLFPSKDASPQTSNWQLSQCKPYLRPMSSMTEEEQEEYGKVCELDTEILANHPMNGEPFPALYNSQDWLNKKMFDYRGLIEKGRAIEVTEDNNPYKI